MEHPRMAHHSHPGTPPPPTLQPYPPSPIAAGLKEGFGPTPPSLPSHPFRHPLLPEGLQSSGGREGRAGGLGVGMGFPGDYGGPPGWTSILVHCCLHCSHCSAPRRLGPRGTHGAQITPNRPNHPPARLSHAQCAANT